jgi:4-azaleucine resistance transporter AzlC
MASIKRDEFLAGVKNELPILLGVAPFGMIFGALAMKTGLGAVVSQAMSSIVFAGSAQFIAAQLIGAGASSLVILAVVFVVNLRHALYSASIAPYIHHLKPLWKGVIAYFLTDEAYVVAISHYQQEGDLTFKHWYTLGAGVTLWSTWQISTALGILIGARIPADFPLSFALPLTFIALVVPALRDRANVAAALSAGIIGVMAVMLPYKTGLLIAAAAGILTGLWVEGRKS